MKKIVFLIIFSLALYNFTFAQTQIDLDKIKEIKLLESNRDDVRRLFAGYILETNEYREYDDSFHSENAEIDVSYSEGKCQDKNDDYNGWDVAEWKVTNIKISPKASIKFKDVNHYLSKFGINITKFRKEKMYNNEDNHYMYHNKDLGILIEVNKLEIEEFSIYPAKKYYSLLCDKKIAKRLVTTKTIFAEPRGNRNIISDPNGIPDVYNLMLSLPEITASCSLPDETENKTCSDGAKVIAVFAVAEDPENDELVFDFKVSGGKIIDESKVEKWDMPMRFRKTSGKKVLWDLSGVKSGAYTITAAVDDGCGFCGKSITKTVVVKECSDCKPK
jgi:hypothetical protein